MFPSNGEGFPAIRRMTYFVNIRSVFLALLLRWQLDNEPLRNQRYFCEGTYIYKQ